MSIQNKTVKVLERLNTSTNEIGAVDVKFINSPKFKQSYSLATSANHAADILEAYNKFMQGEQNTGITEIIFE